MKIYIVGQNNDLILQKGNRIVVEFDNGKMLELTASPTPLPPGIPDGIHVWGGRAPSHTLAEGLHSQLTITPVAANGVVISPREKNLSELGAVSLFIAEDDQPLQASKEKKIVIELSHGKTIEVMEDYTKTGLLIWGGREPVSGLPLEELQKRTESLGFLPLAGNLVHVYPYKIA